MEQKTWSSAQEIVRLQDELAAAKAELAACKELYGWIQFAANVGQIQIARSLLRTGYEIATIPKGGIMKVNVYSGTFDEAIDAARKEGA